MNKLYVKSGKISGLIAAELRESNGQSFEVHECIHVNCVDTAPFPTISGNVTWSEQSNHTQLILHRYDYFR